MFSGLFMPSFHLIDSQNDYLILIEVSDAGSPAADARAAIPVTEIRRAMADRDLGGVTDPDFCSN